MTTNATVKPLFRAGQRLTTAVPISAARLALSGQKVENSSRTQLKPGPYFVYGVSPDGKLVSIGESQKLGTVAFTVHTDVLQRARVRAVVPEGVSPPAAKPVPAKPKGEAVVKPAPAKPVVEAEDDDPVEELSFEDDTPAVAEEPAEGAAEDDAVVVDPPAAEMDAGTTPIANSDFVKKKAAGQAAYLGGEPVVVLQDKETDITAIIDVDVVDDDAPEVAKAETPAEGEGEDAADEDADEK